MVIITVSEVRALSGTPIALLSDTDLNILINNIDLLVKSTYQVEYLPTVKIETLTGDRKSKIVLEEYYPLTVYELRTGTTVLSPLNIFVHSNLGMIELYGPSSSTQYLNRFWDFPLNTKIKYLYGMIEKDNTKQNESVGIITAGIDVVVPVLSSSSFSPLDWVYLEDMNGKWEVVQVTNKDTVGTDLTLTRVMNTYEAGTLITVSKPNEVLRQYMLYECAIAATINVTGSTYNLATGYSMEGVQVQVGVPYTHWTASTKANMQQRDIWLNRLKKLLSTII